MLGSLPRRRVKVGIRCFLFLAIYVVGSLGGFAQSDCDEGVSEKAIKLVDKAKDRKKYSKEKRVEFLREALEEDEDYTEANFMLGMEVIKTAIARGTGHANSIKYFEKVSSLCPNFHSDVYYYLGTIYLGMKEYIKAAENQEKFLSFESDDASKFSKKYETYLEEVEKDYEYTKFFANQFANPVPFSPQVVKDVSTNEADEYLPLLSPDNEMLLFTRRWVDKTPQRGGLTTSDGAVKYIEKFSIANFQSESFEKGAEMPEPFNTDDDINYGGVTLSLNNRHMYLTICTPYFNKAQQQMSKNCDIYRSNYEFGLNKLTNKEEWYWTDPENLGPNINTPTGWESQPSLSSDGHHLYFASWREESKGIDIYLSEMGADGEWMPAQNVGPPINTDKNDKSPFIHSDSKSLYYSSQGHLGHGGYDIFYTRQNDDNSWSEPKNIGYPINTSEDEHGFVVSTDGKKVYYSSAHIGNKRTALNILSFDLYKEARPEKVVLVKGNVDDKSQANEKKITLKNMTTKKVGEFDVENDGSFAAIMTVKPGDKVVMKVEGEGVAYNARVVDVPIVEEEEEEAVEVSTPVSKPIAQKLDVVVEEEKVGGNYKLDDLHYESNSSDISQRSKVILDDFAEYLLKDKNVKIAIHGHTDNVGSSNENLALSTDRAFSVRTYLESKGVLASRMLFKGFGGQKPLASNSTEEGRAKNRRTEFVILSK